MTTEAPETEYVLPMRYQVQDTLQASGLRISDWRGHMQSGAYWHRDIYWESAEAREADILRGCSLHGKASEEQAKKLVEALNGGPALEEFVSLSGYFGSLECPFCGARLQLETDGKTLRVSGDPCTIPEGIDYFDVELNVPSGKIVVDDDLRDWYPADVGKSDINHIHGQIGWTKNYAEVGVAMGFVGNSCPGLFKSGDKIVIGNRKDVSDKSLPRIPSWGKRVAGVSTDLWWYSLADAEDFRKRLAHFTPNTTFDMWAARRSHHVVNVRPGVYRVRWYTTPENVKWGVLRAEVEWVREPDPTIDLLALYVQESSSALECCIQSALDWPTLYLPIVEGGEYEDRLTWEQCNPEQRLEAIARAADHLMCVIGGGIDWHENGHVLMKISDKAKKFAREISPDGTVPLFETPFHWYPFSEGYGGMLQGAGISRSTTSGIEIHLNESFAKLALNIAGNYLKFPPQEPEPNDDVRGRMTLALRAYRALRAKYDVPPMDPDFDALLMVGDAEAYIANYDLGPVFHQKEDWEPLYQESEISLNSTNLG